MSNDQQKIKDNFMKNLKATEYMAEVTYFWKVFPELFRFLVMFVHDVFNSGRFKGSKLLEIGSGATVHNIASASQHFGTIVMTDLVEDNLEELRRWLRGESALRQLLDIQAGLEGYGNDLIIGRCRIESRIRKAVKRVTRCDLLTDKVLLEPSTNPETSPPFDVVVSFSTLEAAPAEVKDYEVLLKRIANLLRPGGGLLISGFLQGEFWKISGKPFNQVPLTERDLLDALTNAGFGKIEIKTLGAEQTEDVYYKHDRLFCVAAEKIGTR